MRALSHRKSQSALRHWTSWARGHAGTTSWCEWPPQQPSNGRFLCRRWRRWIIALCLLVCLPEMKVEGQFNDLYLATCCTTIRQFFGFYSKATQFASSTSTSRQKLFLPLARSILSYGKHILVLKRTTAVLARFPVPMLTLQFTPDIDSLSILRL
jgi:hypothetical protein